MYHINRFVAIPPMFLYFCNMQRFAFFFFYLFSLIIFAVALSNISSFWTEEKIVPLRLIQKYFIEQAPDTKSHESTWRCRNRIFHFLLLNYQQFFFLISSYLQNVRFCESLYWTPLNGESFLKSSSLDSFTWLCIQMIYTVRFVKQVFLM